MPDDRDREREETRRLYDLEWAVLPRWAKALTWSVGLPAFLVIVFDVFTEQVSENVRLASFVTFTGVTFVQIFCGIRAQRRGEI
jgi:hypothetical protein